MSHLWKAGACRDVTDNGLWWYGSSKASGNPEEMGKKEVRHVMSGMGGGREVWGRETEVHRDFHSICSFRFLLSATTH